MLKLKSVIKGLGYILVHTPDMVLSAGTTQTTERTVNPGSDYLKQLPEHIRSYEQVLAYAPNQVYIGNVTPAELAKSSAWHDSRSGTLGPPFGKSCRRTNSCCCHACTYSTSYAWTWLRGRRQPRLASDPVVGEDC